MASTTGLEVDSSARREGSDLNILNLESGRYPAVFRSPVPHPGRRRWSKRTVTILVVVLFAWMLGCTVAPARLATEDYVAWLEMRSMLDQANRLAALISGKKGQWEHAYGQPRPRELVRGASVWFTGYPQATITLPGESVLSTLASEQLWSTFRDIGINAIHTGPMKRAGGITGREYTPSQDGFFDRIQIMIDPSFGTEQEYQKMVRTAHRFDGVVIGDLVPGHTGKGADFRLAELAYKNYPGLYSMVEIQRQDWALLGQVPDREDSVNLTPEAVEELQAKGYIPGPPEILLFQYRGVKDTNWSATRVVKGVDGVERRWVYLHMFKAGQPSLNWLDPSSGAQRVVAADAVHSLRVLGVAGLRLDANPLLGIEKRMGRQEAWVEGHPLAVESSNLLAMLIRKLGGYSFQELNASLEDVERFTAWGPELTYDFLTRPAYLHAMATGDAGPLRLMLDLMYQKGLDLGRFVHALQNHDELMFDLVHLRKHGEDTFAVDGKKWRGRALYEDMYERTREAVLKGTEPVVWEFPNVGFCSTLVGFTAAALGITDPYHPSIEERSQIVQMHLLAASFNAMQPGVFALSGWDLVGALPVSPQRLGSLVDDGDCRWSNRGAFDLMGFDSSATTSHGALQRAASLYGTLSAQLRDSDSFASRLKQMLKVRREIGVALAHLKFLPKVRGRGLVVVGMERSDGPGWIITALNFGREAIRENVRIVQLAGKAGRSVFSSSRSRPGRLLFSEHGDLALTLGPLEGEVFVVE